jgi:hypothetical protein
MEEMLGFSIDDFRFSSTSPYACNIRSARRSSSFGLNVGLQLQLCSRAISSRKGLTTDEGGEASFNGSGWGESSTSILMCCSVRSRTKRMKRSLPLFILETGCPAVSQRSTKHLDLLTVMGDVELPKCFEQQSLKLLAAEPLPINVLFSDLTDSVRKMFEHVVHAFVRSLYSEVGHQFDDRRTGNGNAVVKESSQPRRYDHPLKRSLYFISDFERKIGLFFVYRHNVPLNVYSGLESNRFFVYGIPMYSPLRLTNRNVCSPIISS